jgi:hypothetical protein
MHANRRNRPPTIAALNDPEVRADFAVDELYRPLDEARWQAAINRILTANPRLRMHVANRIAARLRPGRQRRHARPAPAPAPRHEAQRGPPHHGPGQGPPGVQLGHRGQGTSAMETYDVKDGGKLFGKSVTVMYSNGKVMDITNADLGS